MRCDAMGTMGLLAGCRIGWGLNGGLRLVVERSYRCEVRGQRGDGSEKKRHGGRSWRCEGFGVE